MLAIHETIHTPVRMPLKEARRERIMPAFHVMNRNRLHVFLQLGLIANPPNL